MTEKKALDLGYFSPRLLPTGEMAAISRQMFTFGIVVIDEYSVLKRWCYEEPAEAFRAIQEWDGVGDPPGNWIKQKLPVERMNPNWSRS